MSFERIPLELCKNLGWIVWRWGDINPKTGKHKKPPYCPTDLRRHGSSTDPATWGTFEQAVAIVEAGKADGVGCALAPPYIGWDLDEELPEADRYAIALQLNSYTEESVSGTGLHIITRGSLNGGGRHPTGIGVFQEDRLWYCSGRHVVGTPEEIHDRQAEADAVLAEFLPKPDIRNESLATDPFPDCPSTSTTRRSSTSSATSSPTSGRDAGNWNTRRRAMPTWRCAGGWRG